MISFEEYKKHLINAYAYEIDNTDRGREARKKELEKKYGDFQLMRIVNDTYSFILSVLHSDTIDHGYFKFPIDYDTTDYIYLDLTGGYHSDTLFMDSRKRVISKWILKQVFGPYLTVEVREEAREFEEDDIVGYDFDYHIYMQGFPKNLDEIKEKYGNYGIRVLFIDFDGVLNSIHDLDEENYKEKVEKRIAILANIARIYQCKVVVDSGGKGVIDECSMEIKPEGEFAKFVFEMFKKYNIECIGTTPEVHIWDKHGYVEYKGVDIRKYLFRHPEIIYYCVVDDDDTVTMLHWRHSDLEPVYEHLVRTNYYNKENPSDTCIQYKHMNDIGRALQQPNPISKLALKRKPRNYFVD